MDSGFESALEQRVCYNLRFVLTQTHSPSRYVYSLTTYYSGKRQFMDFSVKKAVLFFTFIFTSYAGQTLASQVIIPSPPKLSATAYLLIDADTGKVLVEHNADESLPPASLTKLMTSYIVSEEVDVGRLKETDLVTISDDAWRRGGAASGSSTMFLEPRTKVSVIDLLRGVIIQSGNDASIALAQHVAGSEEAFADIMNQQAKLLGMTGTNYKNATGLPDEEHVTTARDLAILSQAVINDHPDHYSIYSERYFKYNGINQPNRNKLLFSNKFVDGLKTGHTEAAGYCLVASAKQNDMRLISVVLGTASEQKRAAESQRLLVYGFRNYQTSILYKANALLTEKRIWGGQVDQIGLAVKNDVIATIPRDSLDSLEAETQIDSVIKAPVQKGQILGKLVVKRNDETVSEADIVAMTSVAPAGFFKRMIDNVMLMLSDS